MDHFSKQRGLSCYIVSGTFLESFPDPGTTSSHKVLWSLFFDFFLFLFLNFHFYFI